MIGAQARKAKRQRSRRVCTNTECATNTKQSEWCVLACFSHVFLLMCFFVRNKMFTDLQSLTCRFVGLEQSLFAGFRFEVQTRYKFTDDAAAILNSTRCMKISSYHKAKSSCHSSELQLNFFVLLSGLTVCSLQHAGSLVESHSEFHMF